MAFSLLLCAALVACGGGEDDDRRHDPERVARCITGRSGTLLTDPLRFGLSPALRERARSQPRVGEGSILPRPTAFAAFAGYDSTFVPPDFDASTAVPAVFVFFGDGSAARVHQQDADLRRGNLLIVFRGDPPEAQIELIEDCL